MGIALWHLRLYLSSACTVTYSDHGNGQQQQFFHLVGQLVERRVKNRQHRRCGGSSVSRETRRPGG